MLSNCTVQAIFPFDENHSENFELNKGQTLSEVINELCRELGDTDLGEVRLSRVDSYGWCTMLIPLRRRRQDAAEQLFSGDTIDVSDIADGDVICVSRLRDCIGFRTPIASLFRVIANGFKRNGVEMDLNSLNNRIRILSKNYNGWRAIKGDGNCYFRAVYFSMFENVIARSLQSEYFSYLHDLFASVTKQVTENDHALEDHEELLQVLSLAAGAST